MIIECISCNKQFSLSDTMMPKDGSKVRCGSCLEVWFYHPEKEVKLEATQENNSREPELSGENEATEELPKEDISKTLEQQPSYSEDEIKKDLDISKEEKRDFRIFTDENVEFPSKAEMDQNLDKYTAERDRNLNFFQKLFRKDRLKESAKALKKKEESDSISEEKLKTDVARRTRLLFYLLVVLSAAASVFLVPIKEDVLMAFSFLEGYINFITPIYEYIEEPLMLK